MHHYYNCPICESITDDGMIIKTKKGYYLVCFFCAESTPDEEIAEIINRKENENGRKQRHSN